MNSEPTCGECRVERVTENEFPRILLCPLHASVTQLGEALRELLNYGVEFEDLRLSYVVAHLDRDAIAGAREALAKYQEVKP